MIPTQSVDDRPFQAGDHVFLALGTYQGTPGVFLRSRKDANWVDLQEPNGAVRSHPLAWIRHVDPPVAGK